MTRRRILTDRQCDQLAELREQGQTLKQIQQHFAGQSVSISTGALGWQLSRMGVDKPRHLRGPKRTAPREYHRNGQHIRSFTAEEDARLLELEQTGASLADVARELDRKRNTIVGRLYTLARHERIAEEVGQ